MHQAPTSGHHQLPPTTTNHHLQSPPSGRLFGMQGGGPHNTPAPRRPCPHLKGTDAACLQLLIKRRSVSFQVYLASPGVVTRPAERRVSLYGPVEVATSGGGGSSGEKSTRLLIMKSLFCGRFKGPGRYCCTVPWRLPRVEARLVGKD